MRLLSTFGLGLGLVLAAAVHAQNTTQQKTTQPPGQPVPTPQPQPNPPKTTQPPGQPLPTNYYPTPLYRMDDVGKALNLNQPQTNGLNQMTEQLQNRYRRDYERANGLSHAERATRLQDLNRQYGTDWARGAGNILSQDQLNRYRQLDLQYGGFSSLNDPQVQRQLNLTDQQRRALRESIDWSAQQMQDINRLGATDRNRATQMYNDYQRQYQERFNRYLTPEQQRAWRQMIGDPYTFRPSFGQPLP